MGEIDDPHDAENQRQADAQQRVGAAQDQRIDEMLKKLGPSSVIQVDPSRRGEDAPERCTCEKTVVIADQ